MTSNRAWPRNRPEFDKWPDQILAIANVQGDEPLFNDDLLIEPARRAGGIGYRHN